MSMVDELLNIEPHKVSRDMRGYSVLFFGEPKSGKTTIATKFPKHLLIAFEKGYSAIPGANAMPVNSWGEFKKILKALKDDRLKERFETVIIDTADIAYDYCEQYICANAKREDGSYGVDAIGDIPYGKGYSLLAKEFDTALRSIVQMNYGLVLISHATDKTFKDEQGMEYNRIVPTLPSKAQNICSRLCDIIGYSRSVQLQNGETATKLFMRGTPRYMAGSRFKYTPPVIDFTYKSLVTAIGEAIDKQMQEDGKQEYFTDERNNLYIDTREQLNFDDLLNKFNEIMTVFIAKPDFENFWQPRVIEIIERYLGKGNKVNNCSREQVEALDLIVTDLGSLLEEEENK